MKLFATLALAALMGCAVPSLNSPKSENHACSEQKKPCGCPGMQFCCRGEDGRQCCTPDACTCNQITFKDKDCSCAPRPSQVDTDAK